MSIFSNPYISLLEQNMIYFIHGTKTKLIKIGYSRHALERLSRMQTGSPDILELVAVCIGDKSIEKELHYKFKEFRKHGEWFTYSSNIESFIKEKCSSNHNDIYIAEWAIREGIIKGNINNLSQEQIINIGAKEMKIIMELSS